MNKTTYHLQNIVVCKNGREILSIPDLKINTGEKIAVLGPSGAGKSTLLKLLHLLESPQKGEVFFNNNEVSFPASLDLKRQIGMIFQRPEFISKTVRENIEFPSVLRGENYSETINILIDKLNLQELLSSFPSQLSGGELQRVALARVFAYNPSIILLDEPTSDLDPANISLIENLLHDSINEKSTVVWVTHHIKQALRVADRILIISNGKIKLDIKVKNWDETSLPQDVIRFLQYH